MRSFEFCIGSGGCAVWVVRDVISGRQVGWMNNVLFIFLFHRGGGVIAAVQCLSVTLYCTILCGVIYNPFQGEPELQCISGGWLSRRDKLSLFVQYISGWLFERNREQWEIGIRSTDAKITQTTNPIVNMTKTIGLFAPSEESC